MKKVSRSIWVPLFVSALGLAEVGCGVLTPKQEGDLEKVGVTMLCSLQKLEIDDPALDSVCEAILGQLTPQQRAAYMAHAQKIRAARKPCPAPVTSPFTLPADGSYK